MLIDINSTIVYMIASLIIELGQRIELMNSRLAECNLSILSREAVCTHTYKVEMQCNAMHRGLQ